MARKERWHAAFKSLRGHNYTISIQQEGYTEDYSEELVLGANPFETEEDNSDDVFKPVRKQSGYICVVCSPDEAASLLPDTNSQNYVELKRDGVVVWVGFMKNESYNQDPFDQLHTYQFPLICPLTLLENAEISSTLQNNGGIFSIGHILKMIFDICGIPFDNVIVSKDVEGIKQMDAVVSFWNWLEQNDDYDYRNPISEDNPLYNCKANVDELLEQICEFFGWTCRIVGKDIFFDVIDKTITSKVSIPYSTLGADTRVWNVYEDKPTAELNELSYLSSDNKESYVQGVCRIQLSCDVNKYDSTLMQLPTDDVKLEIGDKVFQQSYNRGTLSKPDYIYENAVRIVSRLTGSAGMFNRDEHFDFKRTKWTNLRIGANLLSDLALVKISTEALKDFNPNLTLYLATKSSDTYSGVNLTMVSHEDFILPQGYFSINGSAQCYKDKFLDHDREFTMPAEIKWGDRTLTDYIPFEKNGTIASNKSIVEQMSNPSIPSGEWISVNSANHGKVSIHLTPVVTEDESIPLYVLIDHLNLSFGNRVALNNSKERNTYKQKTGNQSKEVRELSLSLCTYNGNVSGRALLVNGNYEYITSYNYNGITKRPEEQLLGRMATQLATRAKRLLIDVIDNDDATKYPFVVNLGYKMATISASRKYVDDKITLQLQQLH